MALFYRNLTLYHPTHRISLGEELVLLAPDIERKWTDEQLAEVGLYRPRHYEPMPAGKRSGASIEWAGSDIRYKLEDIPTPTTSDLRAYLADKRWRVEVGGMVWNGWPVHTDDRSRGFISDEVLAVQMGQRADGEQWKFADGVFRPLTNEQVENMAVAARLHVVNCFAAEGALTAAILSGGIISTEEIDAYPWPS
jgi:hypothetical protein